MPNRDFPFDRSTQQQEKKRVEIIERKTYNSIKTHKRTHTHTHTWAQNNKSQKLHNLYESNQVHIMCCIHNK